MISIVMLTYNNFEKFYRCTQTMFYFYTSDEILEIIVLDNGSHDDRLLKYLESLEENFTKVNVVFSNENLGIAKGRKQLYDLASGDYIVSIDSDVVFINPPKFIETLKKGLDLEKMMLIGGGGGNHPYYPCIEKEYIINLPTPDVDTLARVDEVAGWFHGFKSSILKKNGGKIYMDERFSPFWCEDSDLCIQIKKQGGLCSIMGKDIIAHQWSSCNKQERIDDIESMWEKLKDKWYTKEYKFDIDEKFYDKYYDIKRENKGLDYILDGIKSHKFGKKSDIHEFYPDLDFDDSKKLCKFEDSELTIDKFTEQYFTHDELKKRFFKIKENHMKDTDIFVICVSFECEKVCRVLSHIKSRYNNICLCLVHDKEKPHDEAIKLVKEHGNYCVSEFSVFKNFFAPFVMMFEDVKDYKFSNVIKVDCCSDVDNMFSVLPPDNYGIELIMDSFKPGPKNKWFNKGNFNISKEKCEEILNSHPFQDTYHKSLTFNHRVSNLIAPRISPHMALDRVFGYLHNVPENYPLLLFSATIHTQEEFESVKNTITQLKQEIGKHEFWLLNDGDMKNLSSDELDIDMSLDVEMEDKNISYMKTLSQMEDLEKFTNIVFIDDTFELEESTKEFFVKSNYKSMGFIKQYDYFIDCLYSIHKYDLSTFNKVMNDHLRDTANVIFEDILPKAVNMSFVLEED